MQDAAIITSIGRTKAATLAALSPGSSAKVQQIDSRLKPADRMRLLELGFIPGTAVNVIRRAPLGDPIEVELRGYRISLRTRDASAVGIGVGERHKAPYELQDLSSLPPRSEAVVGLIGNPNCGKSTLFNALCGTTRQVGNYPGVTVSRGAAPLEVGDGTVTLVDLPGCYSLIGRSLDEDIAAFELFGQTLSPQAPERGCDACVVVLDSTALARSLYLALSVLELQLPVVCVLNMSDEARAQGIVVDERGLGERLGVEIVRTVATRGEGLSELKAALGRALRKPSTRRAVFDESIESAINTAQGRALGIRQIEVAARKADNAEVAGTIELAERIILSRYNMVDGLMNDHVRVPTTRKRSLTDRIDTALTHPVSGSLALLFVLALVFNLLFTASQPIMDGIESLFALLATAIKTTLPVHWFVSLLADGLVTGVGTVLMFAPQIALLLLLMGLLESVGYLSRAAFLIDRLMRAVGLNGKAFVPMLGGYACAVPAIMSLRTLENRRDRLLTMAVLPLMSCSARLPVYTLIIAVLYPASLRWHGLPVSALILFGLYLASAALTLVAASIIGRTVFRGESSSLVLELPPYRRPVMRTLLLSVWGRLKEFFTTAGTTIVVLSVVMWLLLHFPRPDDVNASESQQLEHSLAGHVGHFIEPAIAPLGFDWRIGIGLIGSFAAREVFVSTMAVIHGSEADDAHLSTSLRNAERADGRKIYTVRTGFALLAFFMIACQCMSTLATIRRETRSWVFTASVFTYMTVLAYLVALAINQIGAVI